MYPFILYLYHNNNNKKKQIMKTTKSKVLESKIEKLVATKKLNKNSIIYKMVTELLNPKSDMIIRPIYVQGSSWKNSSLQDHTFKLKLILLELGLEYSTGNDAPRGGKTGFFLTVNTKIKHEN